MKTVQDAAREHAISEHGIEDEWVPDRMQTKLDFKKGVEFAQEWIDANTELPDDNQMVLCKTNKGNVFISHRYQFMNSEPRWKCSLNTALSIVSWRPIEKI
jgi:hypothetical protein